MEASELEGTLSTRADGWPLKKHSSALAAGPRHIHLLTRCACRAEFSSSLTAFGEGDEDEDDSESEDEDEMMASLSHAELCEMLSGTRAQLAQAAELGQALMVELQQMELLKQDNAQLQEQKEEWEASQEEHEWRIEELEECDPPPTLRAAQLPCPQQNAAAKSYRAATGHRHSSRRLWKTSIPSCRKWKSSQKSRPRNIER